MRRTVKYPFPFFPLMCVNPRKPNVSGLPSPLRFQFAQALAAGQLESRTAGKLLYAIQQVSATNRRIEQMEAAQLEQRKNAQDQPDNTSRILEFPEFEK